MKYLEIKNLNIDFDRKRILRNVNFELNSGDRIAIIGKNGTGKTTFVETIMGVNNAKISGTLSYFNDVETKVRAVFQDYQFDRSLCLKNIYQLYANLVGISPQNVNFIFSKYGLSGKEKSYFYKLSGGEKQKFKLLMCLELQPKIIILDEISNSLDFQWRKQIFKILNDFLDDHLDCSLILVSHDFEEITKLTNQFYLLSNQTMSKVDNIEGFFTYDNE